MPSRCQSDRTNTFPKELRLLAGPDFDAVFAERLSGGDGVLVVHARPNGLKHPRLGLAVSRKVGPAVYRNRWKRLLREGFRLDQHNLPALDLVCLPRMRSEPSLIIVRQSLAGLAERLQKKAARRLAAGETKSAKPRPPSGTKGHGTQ